MNFQKINATTKELHMQKYKRNPPTHTHRESQ